MIYTTYVLLGDIGWESEHSLFKHLGDRKLEYTEFETWEYASVWEIHTFDVYLTKRWASEVGFTIEKYILILKI